MSTGFKVYTGEILTNGFLHRNSRHPAIFANFSDDSSKKDGPKDEITAADKKEKQDKAADNNKVVTSKRLNDLLALMTTDTNLNIVKEVIKPKSAAEKKERKKALFDATVKVAPESEDIAEAAKKVAESIGGDTKKTESELLEILLKSGNIEGNHNLKYVHTLFPS